MTHLNGRLPMVLKEFPTKGFLEWVESQAWTILSPTNEFEVLRYKSHVYDGNGEKIAGKSQVHILWVKLNGNLTWSPATQEHYRAFIEQIPYRALVKKNTARVNRSLVAEIRRRDGDDCFYCCTPCGDDATVEHLIPRKVGGGNSTHNLALAHQKCNGLAASMTLVEKVKLRDKLKEKAHGKP